MPLSIALFAAVVAVGAALILTDPGWPGLRERRRRHKHRRLLDAELASYYKAHRAWTADGEKGDPPPLPSSFAMPNVVHVVDPDRTTHWNPAGD